MYTLAIYEAFGVVYDQRFKGSKESAHRRIKKITETAHIHYLEEVPQTIYFKNQPEQIIK